MYMYLYIYILFVTKFLYIYYIYITPSLKWSMVKSVPGYSNITKKCLLCLYEKLEIIRIIKQAIRIDFKVPPC